MTIRILLVEDNQQDVILIREALRDSGLPHDLATATNGEEALQLLYASEHRPNIVLLDLNLPKVGGLEVLREIKRDSGLRPIPVVILTNSLSEEDVIRSYASYCNAYIRKPVGFDELTDTLTGICKFWFKLAVLPGQGITSSPNLYLELSV